MLLGISVLKVMGMKPLPSYPLKGPYLQRDLARAARRQKVIFNKPAERANPLPPGRCFHWLKALRAITDGEGDRLLRAAVDLSMQKGVFGSPTFIVDGEEPFFGLEKMELVEEWLQPYPLFLSERVQRDNFGAGAWRGGRPLEVGRAGSFHRRHVGRIDLLRRGLGERSAPTGLRNRSARTCRSARRHSAAARLIDLQAEMDRGIGEGAHGREGHVQAVLLPVEGERDLESVVADLQIFELVLQYDRNLVRILCAQETRHADIGMVGVEADEQMMVARESFGG
jgi:hypothetical protein